MGFKCQSPDKTIHNIGLTEDNGAYIPAIVTCNQQLNSELQGKPMTKEVPPPKGFIICGEMGLVRDPGCGPNETPTVVDEGLGKNCICDCDDSKANQECTDLGYDGVEFILGKGPCGECLCSEGRTYGQVELADGSTVNRCRDNIQGACCDGASCSQAKQENCVGKPFGLNLTCGEMRCTEECPSNEPLLTYVCNTGFVDGNPVPIPFCVYCGTNQFFNPSTCSCEENCPIEDMPPCSNGGSRDPSNCDCCDGEYGWSPCGDGKNFLYPDYPFEPEYLPGCPKCYQGGLTPAGSKSVWDESECSCKCESPISCQQEAIDTAGQDPLFAENTNYTLNPTTCECYCPSTEVSADCASKGLPFIPPSDIIDFGGCRCDCEQSDQNQFPSEQTCPPNKWDPVHCECDCSDFTECGENKVRTEGCQCKCNPEYTSCPDIQTESSGGIPGGTRKGWFNPETCECEYPCLPEVEGGTSATPTTCEYQGETYIICTQCDDPNKVLGPCNDPIGGARICICADGTTPCGGSSMWPNDCCSSPGESCVDGECQPTYECPDTCQWKFRLLPGSEGYWESDSGGLGVHQNYCRQFGCDCEEPNYTGTFNLEIGLSNCR